MEIMSAKKSSIFHFFSKFVNFLNEFLTEMEETLDICAIIIDKTCAVFELIKY
jgi:hypothetical protein